MQDMIHNEKIKIRGARVHNLKNISVDIPKNSIVVITGISGSGKSSLAFDTIFAEGQRRYVESMSAYARQFLGVIEKPDVDEITNLSPVLSIDQKTSILSPRSTVGTLSDIYDYLRLLFSSIGVPSCEICNKPMKKLYFESKKAQNESIRQWNCQTCNTTYPEITIKLFSFNSPAGACLICKGLGEHLIIEPSAIMPNQRLTIDEGGIRPFQRMNSGIAWLKREVAKNTALKHKVKFNIRIEKINSETKNILLNGNENFVGLVNYLMKRHDETDSEYMRKEIEKYMVKKICPSCMGARLKRDVLGIKVAGYSIIELAKLSIQDLIKIIEELKKENQLLSSKERKIAMNLLVDIAKRLNFLGDVGLTYLTLDRSADTLAGGEAQRIRLASQLGSGLVGIVYILDEPSIGLHAKDHTLLLNTIKKLKEAGNTIIIVEHDEDTIKSADWIVDIGPGAGQDGGEIVAEGTLSQLKKSNSLTSQYLTGRKKISIPTKRRNGNSKSINIKGAKHFNLKNIDVEIPLNKLVVVTGVSGSGKSTLVSDILAAKAINHFFRGKKRVGDHKTIEGFENIDKVIVVDQSPIGRNVRSNPATYTGVFTLLRKLFADLPQSQKKNLEANHFSFNLKGGRCETCRGDGVLKFEMHFLPNVTINCEDCQGKRYNAKTLSIRLNGNTIADVLEMTVDEAINFFCGYPQVVEKLHVLNQVGLGYIRLGQPATKLSGGEAQRIKLATELSRTSNGNTLYILDEPTTGLHFDDINRLLSVLHKLVDIGNSVLIVEHNIDVIKNADWIIDLGPDGGENGGEVVAMGTPEQVSRSEKSSTAIYLKKALKS